VDLNEIFKTEMNYPVDFNDVNAPLTVLPTDDPGKAENEGCCLPLL